MKKRSYKKYEIICKKCHKLFLVSEYLKNKSKYCSNECKHNINAYYLNCIVCKKEFKRTLWQKKSYKGSYCSKECYQKRSPKVIVLCNGCKKEITIFQSRKKYYYKYYCSNECRIKFGPTGKITDEKCVNNQYQKFTRSLRHCKKYYEWRNFVIYRDENKCCKCKNNKNITVHHKYVAIYDFIRKYGFNKELIYNDSMFFDTNNGETLCRSCHAKEHRANSKN